jgi:lipoprotein-releasing system permease protein
VYHLLLLRRYLTSKALPLLSAVAVMLCTATVLIVWSIMGGFLSVLLESGRTLVGDVAISWPTVGFGYYQELIADLEKDPAVAAATPMVETFGVVKLPDDRIQGVFVKGIDGPGYAKVTGYTEAPWWRPLDRPLPKDKDARDMRVTGAAALVEMLPATLDELSRGVAGVQSDIKGDPAADAVIRPLVDFAARLRELKARAQGVRDQNVQLPRDPAKLDVVKNAANLSAEVGGVIRAILDRKPAQVPPALASALGHLTSLSTKVDALYADARSVVLRDGSLALLFSDGLELTKPDASGAARDAMVPGIEMSGFNIRRPAGYYSVVGRGVRLPDGTIRDINGFLPNHDLTLNVLPLTGAGRSMSMVSRIFPVANEFKTGVYDIDKNTVLVRMGALQEMLKMDQATIAPRETDPYDIEPGAGGGGVPSSAGAVVSPARVTTVLVRGNDTAPLATLKERATKIYAAFAARHPGKVPDAAGSGGINISTWEEQQGTLVSAVQNEIVMMLIILGVISMTVSFLILAIFWAIVSEKTKDVGILRAIGAGRSGVAGLWLGYGLVIGVIGSILGGAAAYAIVLNINPIHEWLGSALGIVIWNPKVYYFSQIPNRVDPVRALLVVAAGIGFSVLGALIPAVKAAHMDPVKSLRFE